MPSIRDLKGRAVDDMVDSRVGVPAGGVPYSEEPVPVDKIREGVAAVEARRGRRAAVQTTPALRDVDDDEVPADAPIPKARVPLPEDFEEGLQNLEREVQQMEALATEILSRASAAREAMEALRARAEKDTEKLAKLDTLMKALTS